MKYLCFLAVLISCINTANSQEKFLSEEDFQRISDPDIFIGNHKAKVMMLGVFHFANPGLDSYKVKYELDIFSKKRQTEIKNLLKKIEEFKPTKILFEGNRVVNDSAYNVIYKRYLKDESVIANRIDERYQLGFRMAKRMGHKKIYASDARADWFGAELDWDNYDDVAYLKSKKQYEKSIRYEKQYDLINEYDDYIKTVSTLTDYFIAMNDPKASLKSHQQYLTGTILEGAGDNYVGADAVGKWYRRNLRVFSNTYDLTDFSKEERILMIYGAGHIWQLRQFFMDSPDYEYVEVNDYLKK